MIAQHYRSNLVRWLRALAGAACVSLLLGGCSSAKQAGVEKGKRFDRSPDTFETQRDLPPSTRTLYSMADILAAQGKDRDCEFTLKRCIQQEPKFTPAHNKLAELLMRQGRVHEAEAVLSQALRVSDADPILLNNLGMCCLVQRHYGQAVEHFTKAAGLVPESAKFRANWPNEYLFADAEWKNFVEAARAIYAQRLGDPKTAPNEARKMHLAIVLYTMAEQGAEKYPGLQITPDTQQFVGDPFENRKVVDRFGKQSNTFKELLLSSTRYH